MIADNGVKAGRVIAAAGETGTAAATAAAAAAAAADTDAPQQLS